jgi:hypothetical protein
MNGPSATGYLRAPFSARVIGRALRRLVWSIAFVCAVWLFSTPNLKGEQSRASEYEVKAVYLLNFAKFVDWPADTTKSKAAPFTICVLGKNPFGPLLNETIKGETIAGQTVAAKEVASPQDAAGCQILYISSSEETRMDAIVSGLGRMAILTVSDVPQFSPHGGMIQFVMEGNRVRFEANLDATQAAGLNVSSSLLKVAKSVYRSPRPGA